jgi:asparagine synthase (glutamine-hydrolysing)
MRALSGWIGASAVDSERVALQTAVNAVEAGSSPTSVRLDVNAGLRVVGTGATACLVEKGGMWLALSGHPQWRSSSTAPASIHELAADVIDRICFSDAGKLRDLSGDFSLVLIDPRVGRGILAVDGFGVRNIVYLNQEGRLLFASDLESLRNLSSVDLRVDPQALYDYVFFHVVPGPQTILSGVHRVPRLLREFRIDAGLRVRKYWSLQFSETADVDFDELKGDFLAALRDATSAAAHGSVSGAFLSGGTDSSTISGMLGRVTGVPAQTFSIGFAVSGYDEMHYARIAAMHFGAKHHEYYVTPSDVTSTLGLSRGYDQPSAMHHVDLFAPSGHAIWTIAFSPAMEVTSCSAAMSVMPSTSC